MDTYQEIFKKLRSWGYLGYDYVENGTEVIAKAPHIASEAWLHAIFPSLNNEEIAMLENKIQIRIPEELRELYLLANGFYMFANTFKIYGLRKNYNRQGSNVWQPFDILTPNVYERLTDSKDKLLFIGGYKYDGSLVYIDTETEKVYRCNKKTSKPLNEWFNLKDMLTQETERISELFDNQGKIKHSSSLTIPPTGAKYLGGA